MKKLALSRLLVAGLALGTVMATASAVEAAVITYDFEVTDVTGDLSGQTFSGFFSFDDESQSFDNGFGLDLFELTAFNFDFNGTSYGLADLDATTSGAAFFGGQFVGLEAFETLGVFSIFDDGLGSAFTYALANNSSGVGVVNYTLQPGTSVPEPTSALVLLGLGALGVGSSLRRARA